MLFHLEPQHYSGEISIGSDIIHVSGGDVERDFEDDHLAPAKPPCRPLSRLIHFNPRNLESVKYKTPCFHVFNVLQLDGLLLVNCESLITYEFVLQPGLLLFLPIGFYTILNEYLRFDLLFLRI